MREREGGSALALDRARAARSMFLQGKGGRPEAKGTPKRKQKEAKKSKPKGAPETADSPANGANNGFTPRLRDLVWAADQKDWEVAMKAAAAWEGVTCFGIFSAVALLRVCLM